MLKDIPSHIEPISKATWGIKAHFHSNGYDVLGTSLADHLPQELEILMDKLSSSPENQVSVERLENVENSPEISYVKQKFRKYC